MPYYSVFAADTLLYGVTLTFDLECLHFFACDLMIGLFFTKFQRRLRSAILDGKRPFCLFEPPLGDLGATYDDNLGLIEKRISDFLAISAN